MAEEKTFQYACIIHWPAHLGPDWMNKDALACCIDTYNDLTGYWIDDTRLYKKVDAPPPEAFD